MNHYSSDDPRIERIHHTIDAIEKRLVEARERETFDDKRVDLLAITHYIQRSLTLIDNDFPPDTINKP